MKVFVHSLQVGMPTWQGTADGHGVGRFMSAIAKQPVVGPVNCESTGLVGDRQADEVHHGGPDKAMLWYDVAHYPAWREELQRPALPQGSFGENITVAGLTESTVCIGDIYAVGSVVAQVSQPRIPCWKLARFHGIADLVDRVEAKAWTGWYVRILQTGQIAAGDAVRLLERPHPEWTVETATRIRQHRRREAQSAARLAACDALAKVWREMLMPAQADV